MRDFIRSARFPFGHLPVHDIAEPVARTMNAILIRIWLVKSGVAGLQIVDGKHMPRGIFPLFCFPLHTFFF